MAWPAARCDGSSRRSLGVLGVLAVLSSGWQAVREYRTVAGLPPSPPHARNVVLIVWDTVRAYNLGLYGYPRDTTPNLDGWAQKGRRVQARAGARPMDVSLACLLLHRPVAFQAQFPVEVHSRCPGSDPGRIPDHTGYQTAGFVANTNCCTLRDRAGSGLRPFRGLRADAAIDPDSHGCRELDPQEHPELRNIPTPDSSTTRSGSTSNPAVRPRSTTISPVAGPTAARSSLLRLSELLRCARAVHTPAGI